MSAQASEGPEPGGLIRPDDQVIRVGDQEAVIVTVEELRVLRALRQDASPEAIEEAQIRADVEAHRAYVAAGSPGSEPHEKVRAELLAELGL
jgi:hypothetical protein